MKPDKGRSPGRGLGLDQRRCLTFTSPMEA